MSVRYLALDDYLAIAVEVTGQQVATIVGAADLALADSALHAPMAGFSGRELYPDFVDKAAVLIVRLAKNTRSPTATSGPPGRRCGCSSRSTAGRSSPTLLSTRPKPPSSPSRRATGTNKQPPAGSGPSFAHRTRSTAPRTTRPPAGDLYRRDPCTTLGPHAHNADYALPRRSYRSAASEPLCVGGLGPVSPAGRRWCRRSLGGLPWSRRSLPGRVGRVWPAECWGV